MTTTDAAPGTDPVEDGTRRRAHRPGAGRPVPT